MKKFLLACCALGLLAACSQNPAPATTDYRAIVIPLDTPAPTLGEH